MNKKNLAIMLIIIMLCVVGCGKKEPDLTGKWVLDTENIEENYIEFYSDGTGIVCERDNDNILWHYDCTWVTEDRRLKITLNFGLLGSEAHSFDYKVENNSLIITDDKGDIKTYYKSEENSSSIKDEQKEDIEDMAEAEEQIVAYECLEKIKNATPESGLVQIDDMLFQYGCKVSEAIEVVENSQSSFTYYHDYNENELVISNDLIQIIFLKDNDWYFEFGASNLTDETVCLKDCIITRIIAYKDSKGNAFYAGFNEENDNMITYDYVKNLMEDYKIIQENSFYDSDDERCINVAYIIPSNISKTDQLWVYFIFESDTGELKRFVVNPTSYMY